MFLKGLNTTFSRSREFTEDLRKGLGFIFFSLTRKRTALPDPIDQK